MTADQDGHPTFGLVEAEREILDRWPEDRIEPTLDRMRTITELLGDPHRAYPTLHIAGTNGKTSTARMIDSLLTGFGLTTGRYTSPHLHSLRERIVLRSEPVGSERFVEVYADIRPYLLMADEVSRTRGGPRLSTFETLTAMAFAAFADAPVDAAVVEVGMGGSWDATNVVDAQVSVITTIGMDHVELLGPTLSDIAAEKAGIVPESGRVVIGGQHPEVAAVLLRRVAEMGAEAVLEGVDFGVVERRPAVGGQLLTLRGLGGDYTEIYLPLFGAHQAGNAAVALTAVESFLGGGAGMLDIDVVRDAFASTTSPGRLEVVRRSPPVVVDAAHNVDGLRAALAGVEEAFAPDRLVVVLGVLADKDVDGMLALLDPVVDAVVVAEPSSPRALAAEQLAASADELLGADRVHRSTGTVDALDQAVSLADDPDRPPAVVLVVGSVVLAADVRRLLDAGAGA